VQPGDATVVPLDAERLTRIFDAPVFVLDSVGSTNDSARTLAREGAPHGTIVAAELQTAGRGRRERVWHSPHGTGLTLTVVLRAPVWLTDPGLAQLAAGVAVAEAAARRTGAPVELLWPNDCLVAGRKLAGILVEGESSGSGLDFLVCGIGVNVNATAGQFPEELRRVATSLRQESGGRPLDRNDLAEEILGGLRDLEAAERHQAGTVTSRWLAVAPTARGARAEIETTDGPVEGTTAGISPRGGLMLACGGDTREITVGELIRVRRKT